MGKHHTSTLSSHQFTWDKKANNYKINRVKKSILIETGSQFRVSNNVVTWSIYRRVVIYIEALIGQHPIVTHTAVGVHLSYHDWYLNHSRSNNKTSICGQWSCCQAYSVRFFSIFIKLWCIAVEWWRKQAEIIVLLVLLPWPGRALSEGYALLSAVTITMKQCRIVISIKLLVVFRWSIIIYITQKSAVNTQRNWIFF